ncbi:DUF3768 domain-containing protein [Yoonia sp. 2307UL14-13]|uniref:DUF3768 domain-containing protein n=1 Tax=Yoonia sp. 2307UL14-13 TaxID=3126506 RepID=UPI0030B40B5B
MQDEPNGTLDDIGKVPTCDRCGSEEVVVDAWACWNRDRGDWELERIAQSAHCDVCHDETTLAWVTPSGTTNQRVRALNDRFRRTGKGKGTILLTSGVQNQGELFVVAAIEAVRRFDDFSEDNDPWGEHDFGAVEVDGQNVFWKIDCYDLSMQYASENPANEAVTLRVLTMMLAHEY